MRNVRTLLFSIFFFLLVLPSNSINGSQTEVPTLSNMEPRSFGLTGRIVNGTKAELRQFPHQVSLRRSWSSKHFCGGIIIMEHLVLTAAHCMYQNYEEILPWTILVVAGELTLSNQTATGQRRGVDSIIVHPKFNYYTLANDIAILVLKIPLVFTAEVRPAILPLRPVGSGMLCQVSGWGYPAENIHVTSNDLMFVDLPVLNRTTCRSLLANVTLLPTGMYCAGYLEGEKDACQGDSGSGMMCDEVVVGVVSGGEGCARPRLPGAYTDIFHFRTWISNYSMMPYIDLRKSSTGKTTSNVLLASILIFLTVFVNLQS